jgi:cysteine desulfuration protein SufE
MSNPFGSEITADDVRDTLQFFDDWEDRYRYVIDLGKQLPALPESMKTEDSLVRGCQSQVWLHVRREGDRLHFDVDSDAHIVRGLAAILLSAYNGRSAQEIRDFDAEAYLDDLQLLAHLSPTRGNGLRAMIERIRREAA